jgi:hypothetical protein
MGPNDGVDYNLTLCPLQNTFTMGNPMLESILTYARVNFISHSGTLDLASEYEFSFP